MNNKHRVLICDDQDMLRFTTREILEHYAPDIEVVAEASGGEAGIAAALKLLPITKPNSPTSTSSPSAPSAPITRPARPSPYGLIKAALFRSSLSTGISSAVGKRFFNSGRNCRPSPTMMMLASSAPRCLAANR
jgi:hypothetical protein